MTKDELKRHCLKQIEECERWARLKGEEPQGKIYEEHKLILELLEQNGVLDKIRAEIKKEIEQEEFARSVFRHEEKDAVKAEQCTGSIMAYNDVIKLIDKYKAESEDK